MKIVVYLLLISIFSVDYLHKELGIVGRPVSLIPDMLSVVAMARVLIRVLATRQLDMHPKYWLFFALFCIHVLLGVILNTVATGAVFAGMRTYFRYVPFFLIPAVYVLSDDDLRKQLKFLLALALLQFPLVIYQRFVQHAGSASGDRISGTVLTSSHLSIVLISAMAMSFAFYLKGKLNGTTLIVILIFLFLPITLNETKGSMFLMPVAVIVPVLLLQGTQRRIGTRLTAVVLGGLLLGGFVTLYDQSLGQDRDRSLVEFFAKGEATGYLYKEATGKRSGDESVGKVDSMVLAYKNLSDDVSTLGFGLGIGNVAETFSKVLQGDYTTRYAHMGTDKTTVSFLLWEVGIVGLVLVIVGCYLVFSDARKLSSADSTYGAFALGWAAVVAIYVVSFGYKNLITPNVIGYSFWYLSGCVAAARLRQQAQERAYKEPGHQIESQRSL